MSDETDIEFMQLMEDSVKKVLRDNRSEPKDIIQAISAGAKLMQIKHKITDGGDKKGSFFDTV